MGLLGSCARTSSKISISGAGHARGIRGRFSLDGNLHLIRRNPRSIYGTCARTQNAGFAHQRALIYTAGAGSTAIARRKWQSRRDLALQARIAGIRCWSRLAPAIVFISGIGIFAVFWTTTFISIVIIMFYGFELPERLCQVLAEAASEELGVSVRFEKVVVPGWTSGKIRILEAKIESNAEIWHSLLSEWNRKRGLALPPPLNDETRNWSYWSIYVGKMDLRFSLLRWLLGYGIFEECSFNRVRGVIDRAHVFWPPDWKPVRRKPLPSDFDIKKIELKDAIITIKNPGFRPTFLSVFSAELPQLRKQWLFYDIIGAYSIVGMYDNCLFSLHRAQKAGGTHKCDEHSEYGREAIFKLKSLPIEHINRGASGLLGLITSATVDLDIDIILPRYTDEGTAWHDRNLFSVLKSYLPGSATPENIICDPKTEDYCLPFRNEKPGFKIDKPPIKMHMQRDYDFQLLQEPSRHEISEGSASYTGSDMWLRWKLRVNQPRAHISSVNSNMNYFMSALANSLCTFMNSLEAGISMSFVVNVPISDLNGAWNIYSCGLADSIFLEIWNIIIDAYEDDVQRSEQLRKIGVYSIHNLAKKLWSLLDNDANHSSYSSPTDLEWIL